MQAEPARFLEGSNVPSAAGVLLAEWLGELAKRPENRGALHHWEVLPARPARHGELSVPLPHR